jgi:hypothetical protein
MVNEAPQEKLSDAEDRKLPDGRELVVELARGHGLFRIGFADKKLGYLPDKYAGRYTKAELAEEDLKRYLKEFWDIYRSEQNNQLAEQIKQKIKEYEAKKFTEVETSPLAEIIGFKPPKKRGRKPKVTGNLVEGFEQDIVGIS